MEIILNIILIVMVGSLALIMLLLATHLTVYYIKEIIKYLKESKNNKEK